LIIIKILLLVIFCTGTLLAQIVVQDELTKVYNVRIGESGSGTISLFNSSNEPISIKVSQADYLYNARNETFFLDPGKYLRSNANWIRFPNNLIVPANQSQTLQFGYQVPSQTDLIGSYWSVLFLEQETDFIYEDEDDLILNLRYSIQIVHNIVGTGIVDIAFLDTTFERNNASIILKNTGTNWVEFSIKIDIFDERAFFIGSFSTINNRLYPDLERNFTIPYTTLASAQYYAIIIVDCGNEQTFGHQASFRIR
jgi:hypothetical protein